MIFYQRGGLGTLKLLIGCHGSVVLKSFVFSIISTAIVILLSIFDLPNCATGDLNATCGLLHPNIFTWYFTLATFMLTFHSNNAYNRFWEARSNLQTFTIRLTSAVITAITLCGTSRFMLIRDRSIDETKKMGLMEELGIFKAKVLHLATLEHAVMTQYLLNESVYEDLEVIGGTTDNEIDALATCYDQVCVVNGWLLEVLAMGFQSAREWMPAPPAPPIASRIWQDLGFALTAYYQSCKVEDTPFPFPYQQLMAIFATFNIIGVPMIVSNYTLDPYYAAIMTFVISFSYRSIYETTAVMESPFGIKDNDLPLVLVHRDFVRRLKDLVDKETGGALKELLLISATKMRTLSDGVTGAAPFTNRRTELHYEGKYLQIMEDYDFQGLTSGTTVFRKGCYQLWGANYLDESLSDGVDARASSVPVIESDFVDTRTAILANAKNIPVQGHRMLG